MKPVNIVITGVGGQGTLLVTNILADAARQGNLPVYVGEVHGMAQRGGTVISYVRIGNVYSSLVPEGGADILMGMEIAETYRARKYVSPKTWIITNQRQIMPMSVLRDGAVYPPISEIETGLKKLSENFLSVNATKLARECGSEIAENIVMLGVMAATKILPLDEASLEKALINRVREKWQQINIKAFRAGLETGKSLI